MTTKRSIPYGRQDITNRDIEAVTKVLKSDYLTQGPEIAQFEQAFADYVGSTYAVAVANGTAALHLCALALDVNESSKVITTPLTFAASGNCIRYCGGTLDFVDIDSKTYLLDVDAVRKKLESNPKGTYKGIIPVEFAGRAVNLEAFRKLADEFGLWIIEDACHAPGGYFTDSQGEKQFCGNGKFADLAIFSFHPVKHIASGEGGMITTNDKSLYERLLKLRTHGITKNESEFELDLDFATGTTNYESENASSTYPGWYMEMQELGYNYRLTDFQAALGHSQLQDAPQRLERRREIAQKYNEAFSDSAYILGQSGYIESHAYHLYVIETPKRHELYNFLRTNGIYAQVHYIPLHLMPYYRSFGWKPGDIPNAESYYKGCLSLPIFPNLTEEEQDFVISKIKEFFE